MLPAERPPGAAPGRGESARCAGGRAGRQAGPRQGRPAGGRRFPCLRSAGRRQRGPSRGLPASEAAGAPVVVHLAGPVRPFPRSVTWRRLQLPPHRGRWALSSQPPRMLPLGPCLSLFLPSLAAARSALRSRRWCLPAPRWSRSAAPQLSGWSLCVGCVRLGVPWR